MCNEDGMLDHPEHDRDFRSPSRAVVYDDQPLTLRVPNLSTWERLSDELRDTLHRVAANLIGREIKIICKIDQTTS